MEPPEGLRPPEDYAVYVLECDHAISVVTAERRAKRRLGRRPKYIYHAIQSIERLYVGYTQNIWQRLYDHIHRTDQAADFTFIFPPVNLKDIEWHESYQSASERERELAIKLRNSHDSIFVYQE